MAHYDSTLPVHLACDASQYGVGAVISLDGTERPIAYGSRTLTKAEKGYAQIEREAATIIFGMNMPNKNSRAVKKGRRQAK